MKIIKNGCEKQLNKIKRFECTKCGCIFEADKSEYKSGSQYNETYYTRRRKAHSFRGGMDSLNKYNICV